MQMQLKTISLAVILSLGAGLVHADERAELETLRQTTLKLIQLLVQQGVLTQDKAQQLIQQAESKASESIASQPRTKPGDVKAESGVARVQYVPEHVKKQIADQVREEVVAQAKVERWGDVNAIPEWVDRIKLEGEIRTGYQADMFSKNNAPAADFATSGQLINNTAENRDRIRMRATLGVTARVTPAVSAAMRVTTGSLSDPLSTTQTQGQYENKYSFALDRAYLRIKSEETLPWLTVTAGKIPNPWFSTNLVWNDSLNFEGFALNFDPHARTAKVWRPFATVGYFPLQDVEPSASVKAKSKWLSGAQIGMEWVPSNRTRAKLGLAYYDFGNVSGVRNPTLNSTLYDKTAPDFRQKGNTVFNIDNDGSSSTNLYALAADYQLLNLTGMLDLNLYNPVHVMLTGDYVENIGFSRDKTLARSGLDMEGQTTGYMARLAVGMPNMLLKNDWQLSIAYRHLEADAVLDAFTDSDFHLGGTNNKGYILGGLYGLDKNTWVSARWLSSNEIRGLPLAIDVFQIYFNARF